MLGALLALLLSPAQAQESSSAPARNILTETRIDGIDISVRELQSGRPVLTSSPTFRGVPTFLNGITFGDSTTQTTAAVTIGTSSSTAIAPLTTTQATFIVCQASVTITTNGRPVSGSITGSLNQSGYSSTNVHTKFAVLQDGQFVSPYTSVKGISMWADGGQNYHEVNIPIDLPAPAAGSHTYCMAMANDSGRTLAFDSTDTVPRFTMGER